MHQNIIDHHREAGSFSALTLILAILLTLGISSCTPTESARPGPGRGLTLTIAAAADLQFAFEEISRQFEQDTGARVEISFGSSGNLATQIENGAPIDVFASADASYIDRLNTKGIIAPETPQLYALGRIVLAVNRQSGLDLRELRDLLNPRVKKVAIANPEHAPYGLAARQALEKTGLWEKIQPNLVYGENIRQALQFVQTGNAEVGIIALSIANVPEVYYTVIDPSLYQPLSQTIAAIKGTKNVDLARRFISFVLGPQGRPIMRKYGFLLPGEG